MTDTSLPTSSLSSPQDGRTESSENRSPARQCSERLQSALEARLQENLSGRGSMIYQSAWKPHVTPSGRQIFRLRASGRRTSDSEPSSALSGWPTATTRDWKDGSNPDVNVPLNALLGRVAWLAGWTAPQAHDTSGRLEDQKEIHRTKHSCACLVRDAEKTGWPTPQAADVNHARGTHDYALRTLERDRPPSNVALYSQLTKDSPARLTADGTMLTGSSAEMESGGQLNPRFSGWLMGYPEAWCEAALSCQLATHSRKSRSAE